MQSGCSTSSRTTGPRSPQRNPANLITAILTAALITISLLVPNAVRAQDDAATTSLPAEAQAIVHAINRIRIDNGLNALRAHTLLNLAAQDHVNDLIASGIYGHYGSDGSNLRTRVARTGYPSLHVSENWVTSRNVDGAMSWWMNDWIHRVNILDASWDEVGVGVGQVSNGWWIFVTDFANADGKDTSVAVPPLQVAAAQPALLANVPAGGADYTVQSGDTLMKIALHYGIEWQDIAVANDLGEYDILNIGRALRIPGIATSAEATADTAVAEGGLLYTVQSGDTLSGIAAHFRISWDDIAAANKLGEYSVLQIGMQIRLPGVPEADDASSASAEVAEDSGNDSSSGLAGNGGGIPYTVKSGDTLVSIALRNGITWQELARTNSLSDDDFLQIGQTIQLPAKANTNVNLTTNDTAVNSANLALPTPTPGFQGRSASTVLATPTIVITTTILPVATPRPAAASSRTYTVKAGDTVIAIATRLGVSWQSLLESNNLGENSIISLGQVLTIP